MKIHLPYKPKILISRTDRIGDLVLTTPIFRAIREKFPLAHIAVLVFLEHKEIVSGNPYIDECIFYDKKGSEKGYLGNWKFSRVLKKKRFDLVIHAHATNRMHILSLLARIPIRIGYSRKAPWALTKVYPYNKKEGEKHEAEYLFDFLEGFNIKAPSKIETYFPLNQLSISSVENLLKFHGVSSGKDLIIINPSASNETKMWPIEKFAELISKIENKKLNFIALGRREDREIIQMLKKNTQTPILDLSGRLSLGMLGAILKKSKLLISNDSGPVHIAAALDIPVVSIFGRYQEGLGYKRWQPISEKARIVVPDVGDIPEEKRKFSYIKEIAVDDVFIKVKEILEEEF